ncbi:MAG: hypothetical protein KBS52_01110 [Clostridiales bacterium]|nr:hypothetical protein [Candidatus Equinaster intestinalis]
MAKVKWTDNGWTTLQEANERKHLLEIVCKTENGNVTEVRIRHSHGEEVKPQILLNGENALPMAIKEFHKHFDSDDFEIIE